MPSVAGPRPPLGVHPSGSHVRGPVVQPSGVQPSGVQPSGVRSAGSVVRGPTVRCPVIWCPPVRPVTSSSVSARRCLGITSGRRATLTAGTVGLQVVCGVPSGLVDSPSPPEGGRCCGGGRPVGERRSRTWPGRARAQAAARSTAGRRGRPAWRKGRRSLPANLGCGSAGPSATSCLWAWLAPCLEHDHATWSLWSLMAGWTSLEGPTRSTARMGCGPSAAQPASQRAWLGARRRCELREQWWARQGLNL
jgi:hypothetical protein